jgi:hypothetical protein
LKEWKALGYPDGDKAIITILEALNSLGNIATVFSCEGHACFSPKKFTDKAWSGFYISCLVTPRGEALLQTIKQNLTATPVTVKFAGVWYDMPPETLTLHRSECSPEIMHGNSDRASTLVLRVQDYWPLKCKQRFIAALEKAVLKVQKEAT